MGKSLATEWVKAALATLGAFVAAGVAASIAAGMLDLWETPVAGFVAAFCVVLAAYVFAPAFKVSLASLTLVLGTAAAWRLIGHSDFPESYGDLAYQPTEIPFIATFVGGVLAWILACLAERRRRRSGPVPNNSFKPNSLRESA